MSCDYLEWYKNHCTTEQLHFFLKKFMQQLKQDVDPERRSHAASNIAAIKEALKEREEIIQIPLV